MPKVGAQEDGGEACVLLALGAAICAIPIAVIVGVHLLDELPLLNERGEPAQQTCALREHVVSVGRDAYAAWDLPFLLGFEESSPMSWLLIRLQHRASSVPLALRVGRCLSVESVEHILAIPGPMFRERQAAFYGAFDVRRHQGLWRAVVGLKCDPQGLLTEQELSASIDRVKRLGKQA